MATVPLLATVAAGMTSGYSAILLPQLQSNESTIPITLDEASWIASMAALPMSIGCILGGISMEKYGRRVAHILLCFPLTFGFVALAMATNIYWLLVGRFLTGLSVGLLGPPASVYIGETSDPKYRGFLLAAISTAISLGILITHILGTFLHWKTTAIVCSFFPLLCFVLIAFVPESPSWLLSHDREEEAEISFRWLRGFDEAANDELQGMLARHKAVGHKSMYSIENLKINIVKPEFVKPMLIILAFFFIMQFSGVNAVAFYCVNIMRDTIGDGFNVYMAMIMVDIVRLVMSVVACIMLRIHGRRPLAIFSGVGTSLSLMGLSLVLYMSSYMPELKQYSWIPLIFLLSYICLISIGIFPLPWCLTGELFPIATRGLGSGITSGFNFILFFVVVKTGPQLFAMYGSEGTFALYGLIVLIGTVLLYFILPETKNRTLQDIEDQFKGSSKKIKNMNGKI